MRIRVDGADFREVPGYEEARQALEELAVAQNARGRVIHSVRLDGTEVADWEATLRPAAEEGLDEIEVQTLPLLQALAGTVGTAVAYLPRLESGLQEVGGLIRVGKDDAALQMLGEALDGLQWYSDLLQILTDVGRGFSEAAARNLAALGSALQSVLTAWEQRDLSLLGDLLEFELCPHLANCLGWLDQVQADLANPDSH